MTPDTKTACPLSPCLILTRVGEEQRERQALLKTAFRLCAALAFALAMLPVQAQPSSETVATIQAAVQRYPKQIRSLSCKFTATTTIGDAAFQNNTAPEGIPRVQVEQGEWAFQGAKVINESKYIEGDTAPPGHDMARAYLFDGSGSYQIQSENGGLDARTTYGNRQHQTRANEYCSPLLFGYQLNTQWLGDVLNSSNPTLERVGVDPAFGKLYVIHLNLRGEDDRIWFAPKYGNIAVKIVEDGPQKRSVYTSSRYERIGNLWMALQGGFQLLTRLPNGQTVLQVDKKFVFSDIQVNNVADSAFDFQWPTGAGLYDNDTRTKYYRDASGKWAQPVNVAEAIAHPANRVSAADFAPWAFLVSLAGLLTLGVLRWRRRASS